MIEVNITLFVQMIHFLFVWWFLDTFLCRHLVQVVQQEQNDQNLILESVKIEKTTLEKLHTDQEKKWAQWCNSFKSEAPSFEMKIQESEFLIKKESIQELSSEDTQRAVSVVTQDIVQRVLHE